MGEFVMPRTLAPLTVEHLSDNSPWVVLNSQGGVVAICPSEADARAFVALPALEQALRSYREGDEEHVECQTYEMESVGDNADIEQVDTRCDLCRSADAALAQADGPKEQP
jgi:hypothetical protein